MLKHVLGILASTMLMTTPTQSDKRKVIPKTPLTSKQKSNRSQAKRQRQARKKQRKH